MDTSSMCVSMWPDKLMHIDDVRKHMMPAVHDLGVL